MIDNLLRVRRVTRAPRRRRRRRQTDGEIARRGWRAKSGRPRGCVGGPFFFFLTLEVPNKTTLLTRGVNDGVPEHAWFGTYATCLFIVYAAAGGAGPWKNTFASPCVCVCGFCKCYQTPSSPLGEMGRGLGCGRKVCYSTRGGRGAKKGFCGQKYWDKALQPERWTLMNFRPPCLFCELFWRHGFYFVRRCNFHRQPIAGTSTHPHPL